MPSDLQPTPGASLGCAPAIQAEDDVEEAVGNDNSQFTAAALSAWRCSKVAMHRYSSAINTYFPKTYKGRIIALEAYPEWPRGTPFETSTFIYRMRDPLSIHCFQKNDSSFSDARGWACDSDMFIWRPDVQCNDRLPFLPCPVGGFKCVTGPKEWCAPRWVVQGMPGYWFLGYRYKCRNKACSVDGFNGHDWRVLEKCPRTVVQRFPCLITARLALDLECLTLLRRLPISHSTLSETARHINECNRLKYMNAQIDYLAYIADKKKPTCPKATRSPMDMLCHAHPFPEYGSPDYFKHEVSANYLANCYVADFARREAWQAQRDATIHGHFGRVDHTFAYAKKILSSSENPFVASWAYMNEYNQIGFHAFVEDVSHSELEPAVDHLAKRYFFFHFSFFTFIFFYHGS